MTENVSLSQAFQQWEQTFQTLSERLEKLEQRIGALEQQLASSSHPPIVSSAAPQQVIPLGAKHPSVQEKLRLGLPPPVRARVARWLGEHGLNEQTCRAWVDMPLDDLRATLVYAQQRIDPAIKTRAPGRVLYRCDNPHCPCQDMGLPGPLPTRPAQADVSDEGLPPPVRSYVARWLAQHGANYNTIMSIGWRLMPLDPRGAMQFARNRIAAASGGAARARGVRLRPCTNPKCICHEVLAE